MFSKNDTPHGSCQKTVETRPRIGRRATRCILIRVKLLMRYSLRQIHVFYEKSEQRLIACEARLRKIGAGIKGGIPASAFSHAETFKDSLSVASLADCNGSSGLSDLQTQKISAEAKIFTFVL